MLKEIINLDLISATIRMSTPFLFAALGGAFIWAAGKWNIALEGSMLMGSFFAVAGGLWSKSLGVGLLASCFSGMIIALLVGFMIIWLKTDPIVVGIGGNLVSWGITVFVLEEIFKLRGGLFIKDIPFFEPINIPFIDKIPVINNIFSRHTLLIYTGWIICIISWIILFRTPLGLKIRSIGENEEAARTAGINVEITQFLCFLFSGILAGIGGAYLSIAQLGGIWSENMTAGRGFIAICAIVFGRNDPKWILLACLLFGFADAIGIRLQILQWQPQFVLMIPYILTILILFLSTRERTL